MAGTDRILRNVHVKCSSPQFVAEQLDIILKVLGYVLYKPETMQVSSTDDREDFLISMLTGGWISIYNDEFFAMEEVARRLSGHLGCPTFYLWAEEEASWGYSYYANGNLTDEFCSAIDDLYDALFDSPPTEEERRKLTGDPALLLEEFRVKQFSPDYLYKLFRVEKAYSKGCLVKFAQIFGIQTAGRSFHSIWSLPDEEKFGRERFSLISYVSSDILALDQDLIDEW